MFNNSLEMLRILLPETKCYAIPWCISYLMIPDALTNFQTCPGLFLRILCCSWFLSDVVCSEVRRMLYVWKIPKFLSVILLPKYLLGLLSPFEPKLKNSQDSADSIAMCFNPSPDCLGVQLSLKQESLFSLPVFLP